MIVRFYRFYWGRLPAVESRAEAAEAGSVEAAMVASLEKWLETKVKPRVEMEAARDELRNSLVSE